MVTSAITGMLWLLGGIAALGILAVAVYVWVVTRGGYRGV